MSLFLDDTGAPLQGASRDYALLHQLECKACPLAKERNKHPHMEPTGSDHPLVYIIGEGPGKTEDQQNEQFVGASGEILRARIPRKFKDKVRFNNVVRCRPPANRTPTDVEVEACRPSVARDIEKTRPRAIIGLGNTPLEWVSGFTGITTWRGRKMPVRVGRHTCLTPDVEVLTKRGWKLRAQLLSDDEVLGIIDSNHRLEWQKINAFVDVEAQQIVELDSQLISISCTPDHRVLHRKRKHSKGKQLWQEKLEYAPAGELLTGAMKRISIPVAGVLHQCDNTKIPDELLCIIGLLLTDGYIGKDVVAIYQKKWPISRIAKLADKLSMEYSIDKRTGGPGDGLQTIRFIRSSRVMLKHLVPRKGRLPDWVWSLSTRQAEILLESIIDGDGSRITKNAGTIYGKSHPTKNGKVQISPDPYEKWLDDLQAFMILNGWSAKISPGRGEHTSFNNGRKVTYLGREGLLRYVKGRRELQFNTTAKTRDYTGPVWCLNVKHGNFLVRKNGKAHFTGNCWFYPLLHPAAILHKEKMSARAAEEDKHVFGLDMRRVFAEVSSLPNPIVHDAARARANIDTISGRDRGDIDRVAAALEWAADLKLVGLDYETRGLRPYAADAVLLTAAVSDGDRSVAFPFDHPGAGWTDKQNKQVRELWANFIRRARGVKVAHNLSFEQEWTGVQFGADLVRAGEWACTQVQASILDERRRGSKPGPLSLDFLTQQWFGFSVKDAYPVDVTRLYDTPLEHVLRYNCPDAKYAALLYPKQRDEIERQGLRQAHDLALRRVPTVVLTQMRGVPVSQPVVEELLAKYDKRIAAAEKKIAALPVIKDYERRHREKYNPLSNQHALRVFHDMMGRSECETEDKYTRKPKLSVDEKVLKQIDHPLAALTLELRKASKLRSTYVEPLRKGSPTIYPDGLVHANFNTMFAETGRLSCDSPNLMNIPKRTEDGKEIRRAFVAEKGKLIVAPDYGQIEARVIAMLTKDERFCKALWERYDVHMEWAERIARAYPTRIGGRRMLSGFELIKDPKNKDMPEVKAVKDLRQECKSGWTFALFFGAGIPTCSNFLKVPADILKPLYDDFWEQFSGVHDWQDDLVEFYKEHGYVECATGRRRHGPLSFNKIINSPVQGTAAEIVMEGMTRLSETGDPDLQPEINIHDDLTFMRVDEDRVDEVTEKIITHMLDVPFDFVNVPITIEVSIGKNWMKMEEIGNFSSDEWFGSARGAR